MRDQGSARRLLLLAGGILVIALAAGLSPAFLRQAGEGRSMASAPNDIPLAVGPTGPYPEPVTPTVPLAPSPGPFVPQLPTRLPVPPQPVPFPHVAMVSRGIPCLFCHPDALRSPAAGIPSVYRCMGCHTIIKRDSPPIQQVVAYWERQQPIPWVRLYRLPDFVQFSHRPHLAAGLNCERCHGDVGQMEVTVTVPDYKQMGWCLECHEHQPNPLPLTECQICHF